ncbi:ABC transporter permease subunit [Clostridium sp. MCC353]|uniref:carbohydrate ABC transporter permease n=1 Tax=Clostridium sp. MCC353 TaxID=2592646 RepID=UPI001C018484|nr:sugar ABC transporter permease [Clostridium sp. MCC353]MBT9777440.1 ABC transporter permease subunit [Clostridium sp. MCC353]
MKKQSGVLRTDSKYAYCMIAPVVLGSIFFLYVPLIYELYLSMTDAKLIGSINVVGLENYKTLFLKDGDFLNAMENSLFFTVCLVPLNVSIAIILAVLLNQKIKGTGIMRTLVFMPNITPIVVWAIVWKYILATDVGILNSLLKTIGITGPAWLYDVKLTMPVLIVNTMMKGVGLNMVIFLSALKAIPAVYYEASRLDGANSFQIFKSITIPMLSPSIFMVLITTTIGALKIFSNVYNLTGGGPAKTTQLLVYYIYLKAFKEYKMGYAAAMAVIMFLIILVLTLIQWSLRRRMVYAEEE